MNGGDVLLNRPPRREETTDIDSVACFFSRSGHQYQICLLLALCQKYGFTFENIQFVLMIIKPKIWRENQFLII